jgi:hypothetical protein
MPSSNVPLPRAAVRALAQLACAAVVALERFDAGRDPLEIFDWLRDIVEEHRAAAFGPPPTPRNPS